VCPPGDYMLFILDSNGVPSVSKFIHVGRLINANAASYSQLEIAPDSGVAAFGQNLADPVGQPNVTLTVRDSVGTSRQATLLYVSPATRSTW
jgi:hypothetical protein